jgi:hypothetical protein
VEQADERRGSFRGAPDEQRAVGAFSAQILGVALNSEGRSSGAAPALFSVALMDAVCRPSTVTVVGVDLDVLGSPGPAAVGMKTRLGGVDYQVDRQRPRHRARNMDLQTSHIRYWPFAMWDQPLPS